MSINAIIMKIIPNNLYIIGKFFSNIPRSDYYITSKLSFRIIPKSEAMIRESLDKTLSYFDNVIDLMLIHAPVKNDLIAWKILTEYKEKKLIITDKYLIL